MSVMLKYPLDESVANILFLSMPSGPLFAECFAPSACIA